ncbi:hypothetical protein DKT68_03200 [Micromonospora acroterricola]|uniref:Pentapeptide repeat-containing protein n=1 Tax=Micromonospora acroterricola TaxID=2202421 RepID=A0A317DCD6_9ACTN|nr:hypothetical protein [Micromonospora acroterricola]PWR12448.1 hypothetical protein DKT68_03200 [Micromonospora acroterricola]
MACGGRFDATRFGDGVTFRDASFLSGGFEGAANFGRARFGGAASFDGAWLSQPPQVDQAGAAADGGHAWPAGTTVRRLDDDWLLLVGR